MLLPLGHMSCGDARLDGTRLLFGQNRQDGQDATPDSGASGTSGTPGKNTEIGAIIRFIPLCRVFKRCVPALLGS
ncbi:hypothetical protein [Streptomyces collinus]|uniref:Uncharacterized protein n=1 Tax=Streptomyces collinus TaxID=42684 RepID=A0AA89TGW4_STRCU|nr:hypothetical protein [Streptomyces collinus]MBB5811899.1 hypothetical protein [Streptomyces collinus]WMX65090.1 hypothetical protein RFN52_17675 [Streptomyces collinus]